MCRISQPRQQSAIAFALAEGNTGQLLPIPTDTPMPTNCLLRTVSVITLTLAHQIASAQPDEILITATREPQSALRMPLQWSAVDRENIDLVGAVHINEIMQRVPGAWISRGNGQEHLTALRSPVLTGAGGCGPFYMAADSISLRAPGFCNANQLFDANSEQAERIEVIKGPATALYGSNAMHGVINVLSAAPSDQREQEIALEAGPWDYYRARYAFGDTWGQHGLSVRFNGSSDGGYKDDSGYGQQKLTLRHDYDGDRFSVQTVFGGANLNQETAGFIQGYEAYADEAVKRDNPNPEAYRDARSWRLYSAVSTQLADNHQLTITPYARHNHMEFLQHFVPWQPVEKNGHSSVGLRFTLQSDLGSLQLSSGVETDLTRGWLEEIQAEPFSPNQPAGVHYDFEVDASSSAMFIQASKAITERWLLEGGARLEYNRYDYDNRASDGSACAPEASACRFYRPADRSDSFTNPSLNAGLSFQLADAHTLYLRAAQGFRAPQANELYRLQSGQAVADLEAEEIDNIELGLRGYFDESLTYSISAYHMNKRNVIFQDANRFNVSGARTRHRGIELSTQYRFLEDWYLGADFTWARHRYDSPINLLGSGGSIEGNDIDTAPRAFGSAQLGSRFDWLSSTAELEWVYMGAYYLEPDNLARYDGHSLLNFRWSAQLSPRLTSTLRLTNLSDEDYAERADFGFGNYRYFVGQPRAAFLELAFDW